MAMGDAAATLLLLRRGCQVATTAPSYRARMHGRLVLLSDRDAREHLSPATVRLVAGRMSRIDFDLQTGMQ